MIAVEAPLHIAVLVSDLSRAEAFYGGLLQLEKVNRPMSFPGSWYQVGAFQIHLIVAQGLQKPLQNSEKWGRNPHLALAVKDLKAAKAVLVAAGYPVQLSASGRAALFTQDPDSNVIEMSQG
ncbi:VOC family protein [Pseudanabaena sp. FACHB-2040]|uniref:VOC family protein n=1 Tax=Pseudanabaena sp. FACHB-2040 TaxID=2692859 RepID=UPI0016889D96|nr:VOC family protein [Pseudanabaena sp. FACHB-2040]MBD2257120.1 VOC family protein [Pseudanabaena sp. FACHB-2040]